MNKHTDSIKNTTGLLLCRDAKQNQQIQDQLYSLIESSTQPPLEIYQQACLSIKPIAMQQAQIDVALSLEQFDKIICISSNAVEYGLDFLQSYWPQWPIHPKWYAIGPKTAQSYAEYQIIKPIALPAGSSSEDLIAHTDFSNLKGQKILIVRGSSGRELLKQALINQGADVEYLPCYQVNNPVIDRSAIQNWLNQSQLYALITSVQVLKHFKLHLETFIQALPEDERSQVFTNKLMNSKLIVISERIATMANQAGFQHCLVIKEPNAQSILDAIQD